MERIASKYLNPTSLFKTEQFFNLTPFLLRFTPGKAPRYGTLRYFSTSSLFLIVFTKNAYATLGKIPINIPIIINIIMFLKGWYGLVGVSGNTGSSSTSSLVSPITNSATLL